MGERVRERGGGGVGERVREGGERRCGRESEREGGEVWERE